MPPRASRDWPRARREIPPCCCPDGDGVPYTVVCDEVVDHCGEGGVDGVIHGDSLKESRLALPGPVDEQYRESAISEIGGTNVILLPPPVEPTHNDHGRRGSNPRGTQEPAAEGSISPGDLDVLNGWILQRAGGTITVDQLPVHSPLLLTVVRQRHLPDAIARGGRAVPTDRGDAVAGPDSIRSSSETDVSEVFRGVGPGCAIVDETVQLDNVGIVHSVAGQPLQGHGTLMRLRLGFPRWSVVLLWHPGISLGGNLDTEGVAERAEELMHVITVRGRAEQVVVRAGDHSDSVERLEPVAVGTVDVLDRGA